MRLHSSIWSRILSLSLPIIIILLFLGYPIYGRVCLAAVVYQMSVSKESVLVDLPSGFQKGGLLSFWGGGGGGGGGGGWWGGGGGILLRSGFFLGGGLMVNQDGVSIHSLAILSMGGYVLQQLFTR